MLRIPFTDVLARLAAILESLGFSPARAHACARLFAETTCDGVYSHGVNRFPRFVSTIRNGSVHPAAEPVCTARFGAIERWDGRLGPGNLNAQAAMNQAIALARRHGIACIALGNTNHWMRGGTYGWQAADAGLIALCWTNTMPNLPPWGAVNPAIGNNPLVLAVPRPAGPIVLDIAMSQFSYGALESHRRRNLPLPVPGGFDTTGQLTTDPAAIEQSQRPAPHRLLERLRSLHPPRLHRRCPLPRQRHPPALHRPACANPRSPKPSSPSIPPPSATPLAKPRSPTKSSPPSAPPNPPTPRFPSATPANKLSASAPKTWRQASPSMNPPGPPSPPCKGASRIVRLALCFTRFLCNALRECAAIRT